MERPSTPGGDPDAQRKFCVGMPRDPRHPRPNIVARTRFFDAEVLAAVSAGIPQVVICGAGYDDRALRFRSPGVRFFEVDRPATQANKARRLVELGASGEIELVPADFRADDVATALAAAGQDETKPALFLCEGLLIYLEAHLIDRLLAGLRQRAAPGSTLAASMAVLPDGMDPARVAAARNAGLKAGETEPWATILPLAEQVRCLERAGWRPERQVDPAALEPTASSRRQLLIVARA